LLFNGSSITNIGVCDSQPVKCPNHYTTDPHKTLNGLSKTRFLSVNKPARTQIVGFRFGSSRWWSRLESSPVRFYFFRSH